MKGITIMLKPAGGLCNMRCRYCFYREERSREAGESGFMSEETLRAVFEKLLPGVTGPCSIVFQGGEPTLRGLDFFRLAVELEREYASPGAELINAFQTNGLCIDDEWAEFFAREHFLVGISLDGPREIHDKYRVDAAGKGTFDRVMASIRVLEAHHADYNILSVVTALSCKNAEAVYRFFDRSGFPWQQYIPALPPYYDGKREPEWALTEEGYGSFLKTAFRLWSQDVAAGKRVYNRYFDNLLTALSGGMPEACDMRGFCSPQYVIEADGTVYPCDFYCTEKWRLGNILTDTPDALREAARPFLLSGVKHPDACQSCKWQSLCRGGCKRRRDSQNGRNRLCGAYRVFFSYAYPTLLSMTMKNR